MRIVMAGLVALGLAGLATADDPVAPAPRLVQPDLPPGPLPPLGYYRKSAYEVWQNLAVDRQGYFRARVIDTPYGAFYRYNGQPYPWTSTKQYLYTPYMQGTPYPYMPYATD
jgi:hypothetical protein